MEISDYPSLSLNGGIPDPFMRPDGTRAASVADFDAQRAYLKSVLEKYVYGKMPEMPEKIDVLSSRRESVLGGAAVQIYETLSFRGLREDIRITCPAGARALPVIMKLDYLCGAEYRPAVEDELLRTGKYAFVTISRKDICPDTLGPADTMPFPENDVGAIALWAYGARVCLDYIAGLDFADAKRVALTGHSRDGKAVICAAAMDERFAAVIPNGSGCGGAGSFLVRKPGSETLDIMRKAFPHWLCGRLSAFADRGVIPADMVYARALIAPRPVLCTEASLDLWANPYGTYLNTLAARRICRFLGYPDVINGMAIRPGEHNQTDADWRALVAFCSEVFYGEKAEIDFNRAYFDVRGSDLEWDIPE